MEPTDLGREFIREAQGVFRADGVILAIERSGKARLRECGGMAIDDGSLVPMLKDVGGHLTHPDAAVSEILDEIQIDALISPHLDMDIGSAGVACVRRGPSTALVVILAHDAGVFRADIDGPLLKNLSSQAAIAIEHAMLNERAREQARDLERAMSERSRFFASLSHELRTPINAVIGYNHLLQEKIFGQLSPRQTEALEKANRSAQHLLELVDDILDISKIEAGKLEVFPETVQLGALLRDTATSLQLQAREKGIELAIDADQAVAIETDPARVRQIVLNLLSNAVKFTEPTGTVILRFATGRNGNPIFQVQDSGVGNCEP